MGKSKRNIRKTIGIIINAVDEYYQVKVSSGISKSAERLNVNLVFFSGLALKVPEKDEEERNAIYHMIKTNRLDGLIIVTGTMEIYVGIETIEEFAKSFLDVPIVSISIPIKGAHNVIVDNSVAMNKVFDHLVEVHNYKRIAYISGPLSNQEAVFRMKAYISCLKKTNKSYNDAYVYEGDFTYSSGHRAISHILNECEELPEAIVAANDQMAIGALLELEKRGYKVPEDIAITGFDDVEAARAFFPPITTVTQPLEIMGIKSLEIVCDLVDHKEVPLNTYVDGEFVVRESCGCFQIHDEPIDFYTHQFVENDLSYDNAYLMFEKRILKNKDTILDRLLRKGYTFQSDYDEISSYFEKLFKDFLTDLKHKETEGLVAKQLKNMVHYSLSRKNVEYNWYEIINWIRKEFAKDIYNDQMFEVFQGICYTSVVLVGNIINLNERLSKVKFERLYVSSRSVLQKLNMTSNRELFKGAVIDVMNKFNIEQYYICLYKEPISSHKDQLLELPEKVTIAVGCGQSKLIDEEEFSLNKMLPDPYLYGDKRQELIFYSLCAEKEHYGYIVFDMNKADVKSFETIREQISYTLKRQFLIKQRFSAEQSLNQAVKELEKYNHILQGLSTRDELTSLLNRRGFYQEAEAFYYKAKESKMTFQVIYGDMDGLKKINDQWGHQEGDYAIIQVAKILKKICNERDIIGRMGGDEFTIVSPNPKEDNKDFLVKLIEEEIQQFNSKKLKDYVLSMSFGCVTIDATDTDDMPSLEALLSQADKKLYKIKSMKKSETYDK